MSTTKKLRGWVSVRDPQRQTIYAVDIAAQETGSAAATLVLHGSGEHKEVFTTEEVAALVRTGMELVELIHTDPDEAARRIAAVEKKLGITL